MPKKPGGDEQLQEYSEKTGKYVKDTDLLSEFDDINLDISDDLFADSTNDKLFDNFEDFGDFGIDDSLFELTKKEQDIENMIADAKANSLSLKNFEEHRQNRIIEDENEAYGINSVNKEKMTIFNTKLQNILQNTSIGMRVKWINLLNIIETDTIMNQFEAGDSGGCYSPNLRLKASHMLFGTDINITDKQKYSLEKYGMLAPKDNIAKAYNSGGHQYGGAFLIFNDALKEVTSYSIGDSLDNRERGISPKMFNEIPDIFVMPSDERFKLDGTKETYNHKLNLIKDIVDCYGGDVSFSWESYAEAQYHIPHMTTSCIDSIYIPYENKDNFLLLQAAKKIQEKDLDIQFLTTYQGKQQYMQYDSVKNEFNLI